MKILVTGANGMLGSRLVSRLARDNYEVTCIGRGPYRSQENNCPSYFSVDIKDGKAVYDHLLSTSPDVIIHTAAMTQVDECEKNWVECWNTNVTATRFIVDAARELKSHIIFISTDFIFDGTQAPYKENDLPNPVNYYGSSKLAAEKAIIESGVPWTIARTVLVYGKVNNGQRNNLLSWVKASLEKKERIKVVDDQLRTPTYIEDLVEGLMLILAKKAEGIFHISGGDELTPYQMATKAAEVFGLESQLIDKATTAEFNNAAPRPPSTIFDISKAREQLGYAPRSFNEAIKEMAE